jgi:chromosome partitioning protein
LFSLQGLSNLGPTLRRWRQEWQERLLRNPSVDLRLPLGQIQPVGYVLILQHAVRLDRPSKAYHNWMSRIPAVYQLDMLDQPVDLDRSIANDPNCLAVLKHYQSLMPLASEARKPMFFLKPGDGAIGAHVAVVRSAYQDFLRLAQGIAKAVKVDLD